MQAAAQVGTGAVCPQLYLIQAVAGIPFLLRWALQDRAPPQGTGRKPLRKGNTMSNLTLEADEDRRPPGAGNLKRQNTMNDGGNGVGSPKKGMRKGKSSKNLGS